MPNGSRNRNNNVVKEFTIWNDITETTTIQQRLSNLHTHVFYKE